MKPLLKEVLRWCVIAASGGYGLWVLINVTWRIITRWEGGWFDVIFFLIFPLILTAPCFAVAWFCLLRQYRKLFLVLGAVGAIVLFGLLLELPDQLGISKYFTGNLHNIDSIRAHPWKNVFAGPFFLLCLFGPIYGAAWFYRLCRNLADRGSPGWEERRKVKTRATMGLVWLGVLCMLLPPVIGMTVTFNEIAQANNTSQSSESALYSVAWMAGGVGIGYLLIFLGLVRRRPVITPRDNATLLEPTLAQSSDPR